MMFRRIKFSAFSGITAVILFLLLLILPASTACGSQSDSALAAIAPTSTPLPSATTAVVIPQTTFISPTPSSANNTESVLFAPGSTSARFNHALSANETYTYTLYGLAGQVLTVTIAASHNDMVVSVVDATGQELAKSEGSQPMSAVLPADGTCYVKITAPPDVNNQYDYSLNISLIYANSAPVTTDLASQPTMPPTTMPQTVMLPTVIPPTMIPTPFVPLPTAETAVNQSQQITFPEEDSMPTVEGTIKGNMDETYFLQGTAGEILIIYANASQPGVKVSVAGADGTPFEGIWNGELFSDMLPTTQTYFITVNSPTATHLDYNLTFRLTHHPLYIGGVSQPDVEIITVEPGSAPVTYSGTLYYNDGKTYKLDAPEGRTLLIDAHPSNSGITVSVSGDDGLLLGWVPAGIQFSAVLPSTQIYYIDLMLPTDTDILPYDLTVAVQ